MITTRLPALAIHALLHHRPMSVGSDNEAMQVQIKAVLNSGAIDLRDQPTCLAQNGAIDAGLVPDAQELFWGLARVLSPASANKETKLALQGRQTTFERSENTGGDA